MDALGADVPGACRYGRERLSGRCSDSEPTAGTGTGWRRGKRPTSDSTPPFSWAPALPRQRELRLKQVVGAPGHEAVGLLAPAPAQPLLDHRAQVVIAEQREDAAEEVKRLHVALEEGLLGLAPEGDHEGRARVAGAPVEQVDRGGWPRTMTCASPQSSSASAPGACTWGTNASGGSPSSRRRWRT
jgi:hypothetical protein